MNENLKSWEQIQKEVDALTPEQIASISPIPGPNLMDPDVWAEVEEQHEQNRAELELLRQLVIDRCKEAIRQHEAENAKHCRQPGEDDHAE